MNSDNEIEAVDEDWGDWDDVSEDEGFSVKENLTPVEQEYSCFLRFFQILEKSRDINKVNKDRLTLMQCKVDDLVESANTVALRIKCENVLKEANRILEKELSPGTFDELDITIAQADSLDDENLSTLRARLEKKYHAEHQVVKYCDLIKDRRVGRKRLGELNSPDYEQKEEAAFEKLQALLFNVILESEKFDDIKNLLKDETQQADCAFLPAIIGNLKRII